MSNLVEQFELAVEYIKAGAYVVFALPTLDLTETIRRELPELHTPRTIGRGPKYIDFENGATVRFVNLLSPDSARGFRANAVFYHWPEYLVATDKEATETLRLLRIYPQTKLFKLEF